MVKKNVENNYQGELLSNKEIQSTNHAMREMNPENGVLSEKQPCVV